MSVPKEIVDNDSSYPHQDDPAYNQPKDDGDLSEEDDAWSSPTESIAQPPPAREECPFKAKERQSPKAPSGRVMALRCGGVTPAPHDPGDEEENDAYVPVDDDDNGYDGYVIAEEVREVKDDLVEDDLVGVDFVEDGFPEDDFVEDNVMWRAPIKGGMDFRCGGVRLGYFDQEDEGQVAEEHELQSKEEVDL